MKKENRQAARARRAAEREAAAKKEQMAGIIKWVGAAIVVMILIVALFVALFGKSSRVKNQTPDPAETTEVQSSGEKTLDTTDGLEAKDGDLVNIDYIGYLDGEPFAGGDSMGNGADLLLGSHTYIDGFEEGIVGHKVGETFDLNLTFPENYHSADLAGQEVVFTTILNGIYR